MAVGVLVASFFLVSTLAAQQAAHPAVPNNPEPPPAPVQPLPFSHKTHMAAGLKCDSCHAVEAGKGILMTFPKTARCMQCHATVAANTPAIQKLKRFYDAKKPVPWVRVYKALPGTGFSHRKHLAAGVHCAVCHGNVSDMAVMREVKSTTSMGGCMNCHRVYHAPTTCVTCHRAWEPGMPGMVVAKPPAK